MTAARPRRGAKPRRSGRLPRIGVLGGSFDPVHVGHLILAESAIARLRLDELILVPAGRPAHKRGRALASAEDRVAMLRLAVRGNAKLRVSRAEVDRSGVTFTVRTLEALTRVRPGAWFFLMGEDNLREFGTWREPGRILELARLAVVPRADRPARSAPSERSRPTRATIARLPAALRRRVVAVPMPRVEISSSEIRRRLRGGRPVRYLVPDAVLSYMERHGIYRNGRTRRA